MACARAETAVQRGKKKKKKKKRSPRIAHIIRSKLAAPSKHRKQTHTPTTRSDSGLVAHNMLLAHLHERQALGDEFFVHWDVRLDRRRVRSQHLTASHGEERRHGHQSYHHSAGLGSQPNNILSDQRCAKPRASAGVHNAANTGPNLVRRVRHFVAGVAGIGDLDARYRLVVLDLLVLYQRRVGLLRRRPKLPTALVQFVHLFPPPPFQGRRIESNHVNAKGS